MDAGNRIRRLASLRALLRSHEIATVASLARELGVSNRTVARDLDLLRAEGVPIDAERGRGGGLRVAPRWDGGRVQLTPPEILDVLISITVAERFASPLLLRHLASAKRKVAASAGSSTASAVPALRRRVLVGDMASPEIASSLARPTETVTEAVADAFFRRRCLAVEYLDAAGARSARIIEPHFVYVSLPAWYLLAWDRLRDGIRFFRADRIRTAHVLAEQLPRRDTGEFLAQAEAGVRHP